MEMFNIPTGESTNPKKDFLSETLNPAAFRLDVNVTSDPF